MLDLDGGGGDGGQGSGGGGGGGGLDDGTDGGHGPSRHWRGGVTRVSTSPCTTAFVLALALLRLY